MGMKYLLDTHTFLWWLFDDPKLSKKAHKLIANKKSTIFISSATAWEISTKYRLGKLPEAEAVAHDISSALSKSGFTPLPISVAHAQLAGSLPGHHRDPFDRMLIAVSLIENIPLITNEEIFKSYDAEVVWK